MTQDATNRLGLEKSPYLLQHRNNPVHWFPWGKAPFQEARDPSMFLYIGIGFPPCHWCHMMEKDSFELQEVADVLNANFISIKVDREERPDVDQIYMDAVLAMAGHGGWPMSVFLTPDLKPFVGGTFFWRPQFLQLLDKIKEVWKTEPNQIFKAGDQLMQVLQQTPFRAEGAPAVLDATPLHNVLDHFRQSFDERWGGFGGAPKFPRSLDISLLLRIHRRTGSTEALSMATTTLDRMAEGGMYDHLGGGFSRYSTDERWFIPHFEKMLYDNALLATTYLEAYQVTEKEMYARIARETLDYVLRDMTDPSGGFYSAQDADSEGEEGKYYVWTEAELRQRLTAGEFRIFAATYDITTGGNFEHDTNILHLQPGTAWETKDHPLLQSARQKLLAAREARIPPLKDDKVLTAWNGLMIAAMAKGFQVLGKARYLEAGQRAARFIRGHLLRDGTLLRRYRDGEGRFAGTLEDYSYFISGLLNLWESDFDPGWLSLAQSLQTSQDELFWDPKEGGYFFAEAGATDLVIRKKEKQDGAIPAANSVAALNLLRLSGLTPTAGLHERAVQTLQSIAPDMKKYPAAFAQALMALDYLLDASHTVCTDESCPL